MTGQPEELRDDEIRGELADVVKQIEEIDRFSLEQLLPLTLELTGRLGMLSRMVMHLTQASLGYAVDLERQHLAGVAGASEELERLKLELREKSQRLERVLERVQGKLQLLKDSLDVSGNTLTYLGRLRAQVIDSDWIK